MGDGLTFIGVPIDSVGRKGGTEHGPAALRDLGLREVLGGSDAGDLAVTIRGEDRDPGTGIVGSADVLATSTTIREAIAGSITRGERPFIVGGCCAELPGALAGARDAAGRVGLAYLDGHVDLYDGTTSPTGEAADMPVATALGLGPAAWVEVCGGPSVGAGDVALLGARDPDEREAFPDLGPGVAGRYPRAWSADGLRRRGLAATGIEVERMLAGEPRRFWLHLDVDVLDEAVFPATDYLMPEGLDLDELVEVMRPLAASPALIGVSLGCYNPEKDPGMTHGRELVEMWRQVLAD